MSHSRPLGSLDARDQDRCELIGLIEQFGESALGDNPTFYQQFQPIARLVEFLKTALKLTDEFSRGSRAVTLPIVRANRRTASQQLFA
jgi:hypothetical protein